jgi:hypothetical protein
MGLSKTLRNNDAAKADSQNIKADSQNIKVANHKRCAEHSKVLYLLWYMQDKTVETGQTAGLTPALGSPPDWHPKCRGPRCLQRGQRIQRDQQNDATSRYSAQAGNSESEEPVAGLSSSHRHEPSQSRGASSISCFFYPWQGPTCSCCLEKPESRGSDSKKVLGYWSWI